MVVRCRGRNDREVKENSGVVVSTNGIKGSTVDLSMGPSALSNKSYQFDKVFSPAADQGMVFDEVVAPILDEACTRSAMHEPTANCPTGLGWLQLHNLRIRPDGYWQDVYDDW